MFFFGWFWWSDPSPARNLPSHLNIRTCPILITEEEVVQQLNHLRKVPKPSPRTWFEPSELQSQLTAKWHEMQMQRALKGITCIFD
jgi:hypothetical protein